MMQNVIALVCCIISYFIGKQSADSVQQHKSDDGPVEMEHRHGE